MTRPIIILCACALFPLAAVASPVLKNRAATKEYKKEKYQEAAKLYQEAEVEAPEKKELSFNLGSALYKAQDFDKAAEAFGRAAKTKDNSLKKKIYFNTGNALYRTGTAAQDQSANEKLKEAVAMYKKALDIDPQDIATKFNLQKALQMIEQKKQQQQQQNQDNKDNKDNKNQDKQQQQKDDQQKKDQEKQQQKKGNNQDKKEEEQKQAGQQKKPGEMDKEEAARLLDALKKDEEKAQEKQLKLKSGGQKLEKDW
ncbi:MAG: hypothetical protein A2487_10620 [Candidatus Raymondbacteria bacterium RifOxyC12_full_50_8]|nr:MAG: hypothetical protein A2248_13755 [Candidatus Raymondbacteria bacterium RIFOXYA2_FULL_49_16]OGJ96590.1 MAG: hypothetical protein A2487_10620 [Candidatus Raymondbacteria bacterium RifOxyC12_full_50_8]OGK02099.1 MAG: hypothetical protein A2350_21310 [Candidatus Raymondbacteria bacterium RifOxyB12_full_50_8]OGP42328.1 MAG: hypothetical protein A2324_20140 [Candidatus Raymondbacteria bacterium RIFOXYB2_FULL_49_35]